MIQLKLCLAAFAATLISSVAFDLHKESNLDLSTTRHQLFECYQPSSNSWPRVAAECSFGGFYANGPITEL